MKTEWFAISANNFYTTGSTVHCVSSRCSSCCHVKLEGRLFDLCAPVFRISKRPHNDAATSTFFAAYASGCIRAPSRVEPNMDTKRGALCQLLHPHRRCHMAQAHSNAHRAEGGHKASSHYLCLRLRFVYTVEASCALDSMRRVRLARPHCAQYSGCMQPPKSAATATLLRVGVQNFLCRLEAIWMRSCLCWDTHGSTRKRSTSKSSSSCSRIHILAWAWAAVESQ